MVLGLLSSLADMNENYLLTLPSRSHCKLFLIENVDVVFEAFCVHDFISRLCMFTISFYDKNGLSCFD